MAGLSASPRALIAAIGTARFLTAVFVFTAKTKGAGFDTGAQLFEMIEDVPGGFAGKDDGEFLSATTGGLSSRLAYGPDTLDTTPVAWSTPRTEFIHVNYFERDV